MDFEYRIWEQKTSGDDALCDALQVEAKLDGVSQYNGNLSGLNLNPAATISGGSDDWTFILRLDSSDSTLQSKSCGFDINFKGWQIGSDGTWGLFDEESLQNNVTTSCWVAPTAPTLSSPANDTNTNANDVNFNWLATTSSCPIATISYSFQLDDANDFASPLINTSFSGDLIYVYNSIPQGEYWWRVQAKDQFDDISTSSVYHLIVDRNSPSLSLSVSGSGYKVVDETVANVTNGNFESGLIGWTTAGSVNLISAPVTINNALPPPSITINPYDSAMAQIGRADSYVWTNRLMQSFDSGAKSLSLYYNFVTRDYAYDNPGFFIRLNGQEIFRINSDNSLLTPDSSGKARSTGWQQFTYNLSDITDSKINLVLYAGNTEDLTDRSFVYVDKITTYYITASKDTKFKISSTDSLSGIDSCYYSTGGPPTPVSPEADFYITTAGNYNLQYYCVDRAGNSSGAKIVSLSVDNTAPSKMTLTSTGTTANSVTLQWNAPSNDYDLTSGRASKYDFRYSQMDDSATDCTGFNFDTTVKVDKVPAPENYGTVQTLEVLGLNPGKKYCFSAKAADEAPNWSEVADPILIPTDPGVTVNAGDVIINELMWMGSAQGTDDEWIELRNMTNRSIDLSGFKLTKFNGTTDVDMLTISAGTIAPKGYFLISNFVGSSSHLKDSIIIDYVTTDVGLNNSHLSIKLYDSTDNPIDQAWKETAPKEGIYDTTAGAEKYYSMERTSIPSDGIDPLNWYTCIDAASTADFFDTGADERGTPGAANRSENEPLSHQSLIARTTSPIPLPTITPSPEISLNVSNDYKILSFTVKNLNNYIKLSYELTYDSDVGVQGAIGETDLENQDEFKKENIVLGTCSTSGICIYHSGINNIQLKIDLEDKNNNTYSLIQLID